MQQVLRSLETYRVIFASAFTGDMLSGGAGSAAGGWEKTVTSILLVMGCENKVMFAIAEISNRAHWKESILRHGLS